MTVVTEGDEAPEEALTFAAFAVRIGKSRPYVSKLVADGRITAQALTPDRKIIPSVAEADMAANLTSGRAPGALPVSDDTTYAKQRARKTAADAELAEIDLRVRKGELIERSLVSSALAPAVRELRDALLGVPRDKVLDPVEADACEAELANVLDAFSSKLARLAQEKSDGGAAAG